MKHRRLIAIVDDDGPANSGALFVDLLPVGEIADGNRANLAVAGTLVERTRALIDRAWLAHIAEVDAGFGICAMVTAITIAS